MNDVINRKDAIGAILSVGHIAELSDGDAVIRVSAVNYVLRNLPSAQQEIKTDGDTISRAAAIDILYNFAGCIADTPGDWYKAFEKYKYDLENLPSAQPERKTGRMSNKDWINFLCEQFDISRTSARDMLHGMMNYKKEDNFKRLFNPTQREGEG